MPTFHPGLLQQRQRGSAIVEFALIALIFFPVLIAIFEFGRLLYVYNTMQEVTRRGARAAVVRWIDQADAIKTLALFDATAMPAGAEVDARNITIRYLKKDKSDVTALPVDPRDNMVACGTVAPRPDSCIASVRVSIANVRYSVLGIPSTLIAVSDTMHAESLGFDND